jgi:DmsE family decaheme c-type cytochrome
VKRSRSIALTVFLGGALLGLFALRSTSFSSQAAESKAVKSPQPPPAGSTEATSYEGATYVGSAACADCHESIEHNFQLAGHGRAEQDSMLVGGKVGCESCHGPGSLHVAASGEKDAPGFWAIKRFDKMKPAEVVATCQSCHKGGSQLHWDESMHADRGLSCIQCHTMHSPKDPSRKALLKAENTSQLCMTCHKTRRMQLARSAHMPILEGGIDCASCHDPHGTATPKNLRANSVNELCESCHTDKRGPMLFEHPPVRENCLNCHEPHGANNQRSLARKQPFLCQSCHVGTRHPSTLYDGPDLASNRLFNRSCLNCHSQIHGSNHPSGKYLQR